MPELAEVAFHSKSWSSARGTAIESVVVNEKARCCRNLTRAQLAKELCGNSLIETLLHGKRMLFRFSGECCLSVHLGMTGKLLVSSRDYVSEKHDHFVFVAGDKTFVFNDSRQFGRVELFAGNEYPEWWRLLPPEILSESFNWELFEAYCHSRRRRVLKAFLLLQECFPGVGNWMADEILWQARLAPERIVEQLDQTELRQFFLSIKEVCRGAMDTIAVDYSDPPSNWLFKHRWKAGGVCPKTGCLLARGTVGGRTTCWSPDWQV